MQAAAALATLSPSSFFQCAPNPTRTSSPKLVGNGSQSPLFASIRTNALSVNYNSPVSVFPAEACETIGGDTCTVDICPEVKLKPEFQKLRTNTEEPFDREYLDYTDMRTVLLGEACDVLGGEFCNKPYQTGVY